MAYGKGMMEELKNTPAGQQEAGYQSPFQKKVYTLTPGDLRGPNFQRLIDQAESDADLKTLKRKIESLGGDTSHPAFQEGSTR